MARVSEALISQLAEGLLSYLQLKENENENEVPRCDGPCHS